MYLDEQIQQHVHALPVNLKNEVLDFVLFLEQKQTQQVANTNNAQTFIKPNQQQQQHFVESLLDPSANNEKLTRSAQAYKEKLGNK